MSKTGAICLLGSALLLALPLPAQQDDGDTMLTPRGREAYERHLAELNAKYGADKDQDQGALKEAVLSVNSAPARGEVSPSRVAVPAEATPGQRLRIEILPHADRQFLLQDQVYDGSSLFEALAQLQSGYVIDQVVLLSDGDHAILIDHLLELARLGRNLQVTTAYQQGGELKLISAQ